MSTSSEAISFQEFVEKVPTGREIQVEDIDIIPISRGPQGQLMFPRTIRPAIPCDVCNGVRGHDIALESDVKALRSDQSYLLWVICICGDCKVHRKIIAIKAVINASQVSLADRIEGDLQGGCLRKIGEFPPFGGSTPP